MKNLLILNDYSVEAQHAIKYAIKLSPKMNLNLLIWNMSKAEKPKTAAELVISSGAGSMHESAINKTNRLIKLASDNNNQSNRPPINFINTDSFSAHDLRSIVNKREVAMIIKGVSKSDDRNSSVDFNPILNNMGCPLLLVQEDTPYRVIEKIVYTADLRYCRLDVLKQLVQLARPNEADILIAHLSASGLPDMEDSYATSIFNGISRNLSYDQLGFSNVKEKNIKKVFDVIANTMRTDLLVLVNRTSHLLGLIGDAPHKIPENISTPVLIFPS